MDEIFGGNSALVELVSAVHHRRMKLILDGVFNHCGENFSTFLDVVANGQNSRFSDWSIAHNYPLSKDPLNYMCCGDASYLPKLNHSSAEVNDCFLDIGKFWIDQFDINRWRLDVPFKVLKEFWKDFRRTTKTVRPDVFLFGEVWHDGKSWVDGETFDGVTNYLLQEWIPGC